MSVNASHHRGELICFLYASKFPKSEWDRRFHEAMQGMVNL